MIEVKVPSLGESIKQIQLSKWLESDDDSVDIDQEIAEIDTDKATLSVIAEKDNQKFMVECKFHSDPSKKSDVKVSLYIQSRFLDIEKEWKKQAAEHLRFHQGWIVTNTRFTEDAMQFGKCAGLKLISWDYPSKGSLKERIDLSGLHPITVLQSITKKEKQELLQDNLVMCRDLQPKNLLQIGINSNRVNKIMKEVRELVGITL